ncbi:MAG: HlyD family secretion protein [Gemmataceae bacterium]|nr:HlyD family secretion protein [Gemmataceae bacterium]
MTSPSSQPNPTPTPRPPLWRRVWSDRRVFATVLTSAVLLAGVPFAIVWIAYRFTHSITDDAFVESHLVNIAAQQVSGHIVEALVEEHDRIKKGQLLCVIDPKPYKDALDVAQAKLSVAEANLAFEESVLDRLRKEVPRRVAIAEKEFAVAKADNAKAKHHLELTKQDVEKIIEEAKNAVAAARAVVVQADEDYKRYAKLYQEKSVPERKFEEATKVWKTSKADLGSAEARLQRAQANEIQVKVAEQALEATSHNAMKASESVALAEVGFLQIKEAERQRDVKKALVEEAQRHLDVARTNLGYTRIVAPFDGVVAKRYRRLGDFAPIGVPILTVYNTELKYVTANLEETRLEGVSPGNTVRIDVDAFDKPFRGRVIFVGRATGAKFSLVPRDVSVGEFTKVVQRVPIRIWIEPDDRWPQLVPGLSASVTIDHGPGDAEWARQALEAELKLESGVP